MMQTLARYVYIYLHGENRILSLCEVEVYEYQGMHDDVNQRTHDAIMTQL